MIKRSSIILFFLSVVCLGIYAQGNPRYSPPSSIPERTTTIAVSDSTAVSSEKTKDGFFSIFTGNPGKAAFRGLILPGGGQLYNKRYVKAGIVIGAEATLLFFAIDRTILHRQANDAVIGLLDNSITEFQGIDDVSIVRNFRNSIRQERDFLWLGMGIAHILGIAEAFVDRHLIEFDVSDDLSMEIFSPSPGSISFVSFKIPLR